MIDIQQNVLLAPYTTFKIGGAARFFCEVTSEEELIEALRYAEENNLAVFVLGGGSNILVSDKGFDGLVIRLLTSCFLLLTSSIECGAGLPLSQAVKLAAENELTGLEWAAGVPGSIGGAIRGNAGAYGSDMSKIVESVKTVKISNIQPVRMDIRPGGFPISNKIPNETKNLNLENKTRLLITNYQSPDCKFSYRDSIFKQNPNLIILSCVLKLEKGDKAMIEEKMKEIIKKRTGKIPAEASPGSFFKNPVVKNRELVSRFERDSGAKCIESRIPAPWLIEEVGLRGKKIGGAMVSEKHANFVVNMGGATAEDIIMLSSIIKQKVRSELGVQLQEEIQHVGF
jgi:UDP-N-acetylmuramate dehydrogenase